MAGKDMDSFGLQISNRFSFSAELFHDYCELFILSHDRGVGWVYAFGFGVASFVAGMFSIPLIEWIAGRGRPESLMQAVIHSSFFLLSVCFLCFVVIGVRMALGLRRPCWESSRWVARADIAFLRMSKSDTENPLCYNLPWDRRPHDDLPDLLSSYYLANLLSPLRFFPNGPFDRAIAFDDIPGILPRYPMLEDVELSVRFTATFYPDRIEKGSHGVVFAESYADVHDVVEDRRYPGLAILRHENGYGQLVVRTDLLGPGEWDEVKARIERAKEERDCDRGPLGGVRERVEGVRALFR